VNGSGVFQFSEAVLPVRHFVEQIRKEVLEVNARTELDKQLIYIDYSQKVPENLLRRAEGPSMGRGVEMRFPLLWDDLIRHLYHVPMKERIGDGTTKYLFRKMMNGILPEKAKERPKTPFGTPASRTKHFEGSAERVVEFKKPAFKYLFRENYHKVAETILDGAYRREGIFKEEIIERELMRQRSAESCFFDAFLWKLWNLAAWYDKWIS
jgi:asparagine synthetase B (glutamine-hydrolysing)